jgi:hypothetical protein
MRVEAMASETVSPDMEVYAAGWDVNLHRDDGSQGRGGP